MADNKVENVEEFFKLLDGDESLKKRLDDMVNVYPGSLEIRESLCQETIIPLASELGFPFELSDLRKYETRKKMRSQLDVEIDPNEPDDDTVYWLIDRGWTNDEAKFSNE